MTKYEFFMFLTSIAIFIEGLGDKLVCAFLKGLIDNVNLAFGIGLIITIGIRAFCFLSAYKLAQKFIN